MKTTCIDGLKGQQVVFSFIFFNYYLLITFGNKKVFSRSLTNVVYLTKAQCADFAGLFLCFLKFSSALMIIVQILL